MEVEEIQTQACKFSRVGNGRNDSSKIGHQKGSDQQYPDDEDGELKRSVVVAAGGDDSGGGGGNRLRGWHHSSRIIRVSRASGGKDRHSKVWTSKGLRDRRVRLSVTTAIQFYDLQDRLGYDQPSKAVEWLIKSASDAIAELPSLNSAFPDTPKQLSDEKRASNEHGFDSADVEIDGETNFGQSQSQNQNQNQQHLSLSKSACSSTSETSKGSGLSLSRSEIRVNRVKARERARERAAKDKEKENESRIAHHHQNVNPISQNSSFTELLTGGINSVNNNNNNNNNSNTSPTGSAHQNPNGEPNLFHKAAAVARHWSAAPMDYFSTGFLGQSLSSRTHHSSGGFPGQIQLGNSLPHTMSMSIPTFNVSGENNHQELPPHYPFVDHLIPVTTQPGAGGGDYNLNFTISSSGLAGFNRGTLQSNLSPSHLPPNLQRFASPIDGSNVPFLMGTTTTSPVENHHHHHHHQFSPGFDGRLQLRYGDGSSRHSDQKGKGKH